MKKIRILHIIESLNLGGAERRLINDLKFIDKSRFENAICVLQNRVPLEKEILALNMPLYKMDFRSFIDFKGFFRLLKVIRSFRPEIIHTQLFWADILGRIVGRIAGVPVIVTTVQSSVYEPGNSYLFSRKRKFIDMLTGRLFNHKYIAVSEFVKKSITRRLGIRRDIIEVIYNSIDFYNFNSGKAEDNLGALRKKLGLDNILMVLSTVGRLNPAKGHRFLFEAISLFKSEMPSLKLLVIGDGPTRNELESYARHLNIDNEVVFMGIRDDVEQLLRISDIFIFPTLSEGMPISLLEAMAQGLPCIASDIEPIREVINDKETGYLFSPGNSQELAFLIKEVFKSRQSMKEVGFRGAEFVRKKFDANEMAVRLGRFYDEAFMEIKGEYEKRNT